MRELMSSTRGSALCSRTTSCAQGTCMLRSLWQRDCPRSVLGSYPDIVFHGRGPLAVFASGCLPMARLVFVTRKVAMLFCLAASTAPGAIALSTRDRATLQRVLATFFVVPLREIVGQHYDVQRLAPMHSGCIFRSSHSAGLPAGGVAIVIRSGQRADHILGI